MRKVILLTILLISSLCGCSRESFNSFEGDILNFNGVLYTCSNISLPDIRVIGKMAAKTENRVSENAYYGYVLKDGDSLSLKEGSEIYEINGIDIKNMVAVKGDNYKYLIYINNDNSDIILKELYYDLENAVGMRINKVSSNKIKLFKEIYDIDKLNSIKDDIMSAEEYMGDVEGFDKFYTIEFLVPYMGNNYKPCLSLVLRMDDKDKSGILYKDGIRIAGPSIKSIIQQNY